MKYKLDEIEIKVESFFKTLLLMYFCVIYAFFEYRVFISAIFILMFLYYFIAQRKKLTIFFVWNLLFIIWCVLSIAWSYNTAQTVIEARIVFEIAIISNLLIAFIDNKDKLISVYKILIFSGLIFVLRLAYEFPLGTWLLGRLGDQDFNPNRIGLYLTISAIITLYFAQIENIKHYYILYLFFSIVIFLTGSRKAFIMLIMGSSLLYFLNTGRGASKRILSIPITITIMFLGYYVALKVPLFYEILGSRLESMLSLLSNSGSVDYSSKVRSEMIGVGKSLFFQKPIIGYGIGSYSILSGFNTYSHNNFIELLVGLGIIGFGIYYIMIFYILLKLFKVRKQVVGNPLLIILLMLIIMDYGLISYNGFVYQLIIAMGFVATRVIKSNSTIKSD